MAIVAESAAVRSRLAELGIEESQLIEAVQQGFAAFASCTANHPRLLPGLLAWGETVKSLREQLIPVGWTRSDDGNLSLVINGSGDTAIAVSTGDESTGLVNLEPCTKSSKGPRTAAAVTMNQQLELFPADPSLPVRFERVENRSTWWLLMHRDREAREVRCELSRPINMSSDGRIDDWAERIILTSVPFDADSMPIPEPQVEQTPEITFEIRRRV